MHRPPEIKTRISSGGIIFRGRAESTDNPEGSIEAVLVAVRGGETWCLPKGIIDKGEDPPETALREVREETGLTGRIVEKIGRISYWYFIKAKSVRIHKTVHFYLIKYIEGSTDDHDHEVDEARWFQLDAAVERLSYKNEREIMRKAKVMIEKMSWLNPE